MPQTEWKLDRDGFCLLRHAVDIATIQRLIAGARSSRGHIYAARNLRDLLVITIKHRDAQDEDVIVEQTQIAQTNHGGEIEKASFDRGFYAPENEEKLSKIVASLCLPPRHPKQYAKKLEEASIEFRTSRQRHPGIESAINALQTGNGMKRCRDRIELGLERYLGLAILGRNLHALGKLLIARQNGDSNAAISKRNAA